ncbi:exodeoxyribonuclease V subunit gamma [Thauera sinica]|uniref:RecBCD enzyme subunit RecC n=1 Tax=Thauera sinica TaxID=2665146 RepID=A0ABW1APW2_9RHOO|nr:exodeoxyribonuclease V subunit gamma [Thauera sp. K11]ATE62226.1 exodeoxyribonuclease V subunit gamma [Thauera sp. K11]
MFHLAFSNRFEILLDMLLDRLADERPGPFGRRHVVVPSSALRRRVELAVAAREGVCANLDFAYLAQWLWAQIGRVVEVPERSPFAPALLAWRIHGLLDSAAADGWLPAHPRLARYLEGADAAMRFELAGRIARVFDHYLTYRPRWLEQWAAGKAAVQGAATEAERADEAWQAELWRRIRAGLHLRQEHPAALFLRRVAAMGEAELAAAGLPRTVHVFGLPALPPLYLEMLRELARVVEVRLYVLNPCREYWFEIVDARRLSWLASRQQDMFHETGNRLLAAWGRQTQAHIGLLFDGEREVQEEAAFAPHPGKHVLARLQNAILDLQDLEPGSVALAERDRSIELHACHSRTRELEVLHDRLLGLFAGRNPPRPDEIVVLTPDLDAAAPLIEAVFGTAPAGRRIPWRITGLGGTRENPVAQVLDRLLTLAAGRFPASRVFDLLQQPPVAANFGLDEAALATVHDWMRAAGIRWGLGGDGGPARHTLDEGLHRLYLAWAAGEASWQAPFAGRIGAAAPEGNAALALGRFWRYARTLRALREALLRPQDAEGWRRTLGEALAALVGDSVAWADELRDVRAAVASLAESIAGGGLSAPVPPDVVHAALAGLLDDPARGGVPGGTVTFSALPALRGLPYRVVCVIGLDHGAFPGSDRAAEFDLMAARPQRGDRQRRLDDRNLFLDVLLSARDVLHLSYVGRSVRDGGVLPPSVLVDELFDTLAAACAADPADPASLAAARRRLTVAHPLQPFAADYFLPSPQRDPRLVSYHEEYAAALAARLGAASGGTAGMDDAQAGDEGGEDEGSAADGEDRPVDDAVHRPFFIAPLPPPGEEWRDVGLAQLIRFFGNPCRYLLRERIGLDLPEADDELEDVEGFIPDWPARQALAQRLLPALLDRPAGGTDAAAAPSADLLELARAGGEYPPGALGEGELLRELASLRGFASAVAVATADAPLPPQVSRIEFELGAERWTLTAAFANLHPGGLLRQRYDDTRVADYLSAWFSHLALCAAPVAGAACETRGLSRDGTFAFPPLAAAEAHRLLGDALALYREGLSRPLHFFPKSAWACVANGDNGARAHARWSGGNRPEHGEGSDPAYRLALRGEPVALDETFFELARRVLGPLRQHLRDERLG